MELKRLLMTIQFFLNEGHKLSHKSFLHFFESIPQIRSEPVVIAMIIESVAALQRKIDVINLNESKGQHCTIDNVIENFKV